MTASCVLQTRVDKETKERAQKAFAKRGMSLSEGIRVAINHELKVEPSASERLCAIFDDADKKVKASGMSEPSVESIVKFCNSVKQQRANQAADLF